MRKARKKGRMRRTKMKGDTSGRVTEEKASNYEEDDDEDDDVIG